MLFSLNKIHFPDEKSTNFSPAPAKFVAQPDLVVVLGGGAKNFAGAEGAGEKLLLFYLENEVYLGKIAFASENLEKFSPPAGYFSVQHL